MKRKTDDSISLVYAYGCGEVVSGLEFAYAEQVRNRALWDRLVAIDGEHDAAILRAASGDDERLVTLRAEIYFAGRALSEAIEERAKERKRMRGNAIPESLDAAVTAASGRHKAARTEFFARLKAWRNAHPEAMREFERARHESIKTARNASGLYWPNYNRVIQSFDAARTLCRKIGRRIRTSDEERQDGCLSVQIQRTRSGLGAAPCELQDGSFSALQIGLVDPRAYERTTPRGERGRLCQTTVEMRIDAEGHHIRLRAWIHRPLPADCRIKSAQLTWRDGGARGRKWQLALTLSLPRKEITHPHPHAIVGVDVGWRAMADGQLRVAYFADSAGKHGEIALSRQWMEHMDWVERTRSEIDAEVIYGEHAIRHAELRVKGGRSKALGHRRERYRLLARDLAMRYGVIAIEQLDLAGMAFQAGAEIAPGQRQRAALYSLLAEIRHQAAKHGSRLIEMEGPSTMQCSACGHVHAPIDRAQLLWTCTGCGATWDQDRNAATNLMLAAVFASAPLTQQATPRKNKVLPVGPRAPKRSARKLPASVPGINELG